MTEPTVRLRQVAGNYYGRTLRTDDPATDARRALVWSVEQDVLEQDVPASLVDELMREVAPAPDGSGPITRFQVVERAASVEPVTAALAGETPPRKARQKGGQ